MSKIDKPVFGPIAGRRLLLVLSVLPVALFGACRQDMHDQPKYEPLEQSAFFADQQASRRPVEGTVARGQLQEDSLFYTGRLGQGSPTGGNVGQRPNEVNQAAGAPNDINIPRQTAEKLVGSAAATQEVGVAAAAAASGGAAPGQGFATAFPFPITAEVMERGQTNYNVFCSVCHDRVGSGNGMIVRRGYRQPPSLHIQRLREAPPGYFFDVITNGFGAMPDYSSQIRPRDRWAIIAYLRALQLSQNAAVSDVPEAERGKLENGRQR